MWRFFLFSSLAVTYVSQARGQEIAITISPDEALIGVPISWRVDGLEPDKEVAIIGQASDGVADWRSKVVFRASIDGDVDPSQMAPLSGSYEGVQPMGLIWSMAPMDERSGWFNNKQNYTFKLSVEVEGVVVDHAEILRLSPATEDQLASSNINQNGLAGRLWRPYGEEQYPGIIYIGGSGGGFSDVEAAQIALEGFVVLDLLYSGQGSTGDDASAIPENLVRVPIEYFGNAVDWLGAHSNVESDQIGIYGHSRGTEAAILTAAYFEQVKAVVVRSPSAVAWMGPGRAGFRKSAWLWQGNQITFLNMGLRDGLSWLRKLSRGERAIVTRHMFENPLSDKMRVQRALLPVEEMHAPILMISGADDQQWPSDLMAELLVQQLDKASFAYEYRHESFQNAGHRPVVPFTPVPVEARQTFANGGTAPGNVLAGVEGLRQTVEFFKEHLVTNEE